MISLSPLPDRRDMISSRVVSIPDGRNYGVSAHVPCKHVAIFEYPDCVRTLAQPSDNHPPVWTVEAKPTGPVYETKGI